MGRKRNNRKETRNSSYDIKTQVFCTAEFSLSHLADLKERKRIEQYGELFRHGRKFAVINLQ